MAEIEEENFNVEEIVFQIISYAGDSKSNSLMALDYAGKDNFKEADEYIEQASKEILKAHDLHTKLLQKFSQGEKVDVNILVTHAQDHFMNAILARDLIKQFIVIMKNKEAK